MSETQGPKGGVYLTGQDLEAHYGFKTYYPGESFRVTLKATGAHEVRMEPPGIEPLVEVTQADRELVAFFHDGAGYAEYAEHVRKGTNANGDADDEIQRVARHRRG